MNILYLITQADGGGAQKYVLSLAKHFKGAIAAGNEAVKLLEDAKTAGLRFYSLKHLKRNIHLWHDFLAVWEIRKLVKDFKPNIVHLNSTKAGILGSFAAMGLKTKVIFTAHGFRYLEPLSLFCRFFYFCLEKFVSLFRDFIICVSNADRKSALRHHLIDENKIRTIHNGIEKINFLFRDDARKALGLPLDKRIIVTIANDYETKGLDVLEKAIFKPIAGTMTAVIGKVSDKRQSNEQIRYLGYKPNASIYFKAFDGTVIPSKKEGFPFVALEALQAGQPIIATNVGGVPEALGDAGILIEPDDPQALSECFETEFVDEKKTKELSQKAAERSKLFTRERMLQETEKVYEQVLKN